MLGDLLSGYPHELILHTPLYIYTFSFMDIIPFHLDVMRQEDRLLLLLRDIVLNTNPIQDMAVFYKLILSGLS